MPKKVEFLGRSRERLREFPDPAKARAGHQLHMMQQGSDPSDFKPLPPVGQGVFEIRVRDDDGNQFRVVYVAKFEGYIYVLHAFSKKTQQTSQKDIDEAKTQYKALLKNLGVTK